jgi:hypothetical protein
MSIGLFPSKSIYLNKKLNSGKKEQVKPSKNGKPVSRNQQKIKQNKKKTNRRNPSYHVFKMVYVR